MSTRPGEDDRVRREFRADLLHYFRDMLVSYWPDQISMETILADANLDAGKYIVDTPRPEDRWYHALKKIDSHNKLLNFVATVQQTLDVPNDELNRLYALEEGRLKEAELKLQAEQENDAIEQLYTAQHAHSVPPAGTQELADPTTIGSAPSSVGRIFVCYRREDTRYPAGWLFEKLAEHFGDAQVFKDIDSILLGDDFVEEITSAVGSCAVLLALIGDRWLTVIDDSGRRRLDDPGDLVRMEIEAALQRNVRVVPILVGDARMPSAAELPSSLARLTYRQALELSDSRFNYDISRLLRALDRILGGRESR
jgi:hypothetical protein